MRPTRLLMAMLCVGWGATGSATADLRDGLVAYYPFEGDLTDASGKGHDAQPSGGGTARYVEGFLGQAVDTRQTAVDCGTWDPSDEDTDAFSASCWVHWLGLQGAAAQWQGILAKRTGWGAGLSRWQLELGDGSATAYLTNQPNGGVGSLTLVQDEWQHIAISFDGSNAAVYFNGSQVGGGAWTLDNDTDATLCIGMSQATNANRFNGYIDEAAFWNRGLSQDEVARVYNAGQGQSITGPPLTATKPSPAGGASDVPIDVTLSWTPAGSAASHNVYLGMSRDDVNDADIGAPMGVLVSENHDANSFGPEDMLDFGRTYYWRVDEVNAAPDHTIFKGPVWSFTTEPFSYPLVNVTASASSSRPGMEPQNAVNGAGLNATDQHSTEPTQMWMSAGVLPNWIQFEFDRVYKLDEMWVWNSNQLIESFIGFGAKDVTVEYSTDGETWMELGGVPEFAQADGSATYTANTVVDFGGVLARYVRLTINGNWGGLAQTGLSKVRFFQIPILAREPFPADGAVDVGLDTTFNWRPGREATSHEVYLAADASAVADAVVAAEIVTDHRFAPAGMEFGTTYYWKVNEVGDNGTYEGDLWSFTSREFAPIDDFENYTDVEGERIYQSWVDGLTTGASGSQVGYDMAPFAEKTLVHGGRQSMPLTYDNTQPPFYSEAERAFDSAQDWTVSGAMELSLWTRGYPSVQNVAVAESGGKMSLTGAGADIWGNSDQFTYAYKTLSGDGALVARVTGIGPGSNTWAKGGVMIRDSLDGGSTHAMMVMSANTDGTAGNGASFQYRATTDGASASTDSAIVVAPPYWVKIERVGDNFTGYTSANGTTWSMVDSTIITMEDPVYIGLCVTSHAAGEDRTFDFDSLAATGNVAGSWQGAVIDSPRYNAAADMYLAVEDSSGKTATATITTAANVADWTRWVIPMGDLAGVNFGNVRKLRIGVGAPGATTPGGAGIVFLDDIGYGRSR